MPLDPSPLFWESVCVSVNWLPKMKGAMRLKKIGRKIRDCTGSDFSETLEQKWLTVTQAGGKRFKRQRHLWHLYFPKRSQHSGCQLGDATAMIRFWLLILWKSEVSEGSVGMTVEYMSLTSIHDSVFVYIYRHLAQHKLGDWEWTLEWTLDWESWNLCFSNSSAVRQWCGPRKPLSLFYVSVSHL